MAVRDLIARGVGFNPGSVKFIPTLGLTPSIAVKTLVWGERVHETSTTSGMGNLHLAGAAFNKRTFASVLNSGDYCYGFAASQTTNNLWEVNLFQMQADGTLARAATPIRSSNGGALVAFDGSTLDVVLDVPANVLLASLSTPGYTGVAR